MIRKTFATFAVVATLAGAACAPLPPGSPPDARREVDLRRVQAAAQFLTTTLTTAGEAALTMSRWNDAQRTDIRKAMDALAIANETLQTPREAPVDVRTVVDGMLTVAQRLVPMLGLSDDSRILALTGIGVLRGLVLMIPPRAQPVVPA